jgi:hypothetical protein
MPQELLYPSLSRGLIGAWCPSKQKRSSSTLIDYSGNNNHGTLQGMVPSEDWVVSGGKVALDFDGTDDYVLLPSINATIWTLSTWIRIRAYPSSFGRIFAQLGYQAEFALDGSGVLNYYGGAGWTAFGGVLSTDVWQNVAFSFDGSLVKAYLNGSQTGSTYSGGQQMSGVSYISESQLFSPGDAFNGQQDDIRIYNRSLSPSEIKTLSLRRGIAFETKRKSSAVRGWTAPGVSTRKSVLRFPELSNGLVGAWCPSKQKRSSSTLIDYSGNNNHGTLAVGMDPATAWKHNESKVALDFDGVNDYVDVAPITIPGASASVSYWVRLNNAIPAPTGIAFFTTAYNIVSHYPHSDGVIYDITFRSSRVDGITPSSAVDRTKWHLVVVTTDGTAWKMYQNAIEIASVAAQPSIFIQLIMFGKSANVEYFSSGQLDDVRLYNRALSPSEIKTLSLRRGIAFETVRTRSPMVTGAPVASTSKASVKVGGVWKSATPFVKVAGVWKSAIAWIKSGGVWKQIVG